MNADNTQLNDGDKKKIQKMVSFEKEPLLGIISELSDVNENLEKVASKAMPEMKMPEVQKVSIEGAEVITIKGEKGDKGDIGDKGETGDQGIDGLNGKDGKNGTDGRDGIDGVDGDNGKDGIDGKGGSPDNGEQIIEKINNDKSEKLIKKEKVEGLDEAFKEVDTKINSIPRGGGVGAMAVRQAFKYIFHTEEPTGLINGSNTTYTVTTAIWAIIGFTLNGESIAELPNYTFANRTITFASALPSAYSGKDFEIKYIG